MDNGGCPELCRNLNGSFECYRSCRDGYRLDNNRRDCLGTETKLMCIVMYFVSQQILMNVLKVQMNVSICV